jgi:tRNA pseudouridine55 synthase
MFDGILLIDKPKGWTSFDVVAKVRGIVRRETGQKKVKIGHTGTLDPLATGLLVLVLGGYTKRVPELSKADKTYEVTMRLGQTSTTGDEEGQKTPASDKKPSEAEVLAALRHFVGEIQQIPPAYSAIKVHGQRAYKLARAGKEVAIEPRSVTIYEITDVVYDYPQVRFTATVSSGTYIRSLVEDIGKRLDTGAYMSALYRTEVGDFSVTNAAVPDGLTGNLIQERLIRL